MSITRVKKSGNAMRLHMQGFGLVALALWPAYKLSGQVETFTSPIDFILGNLVPLFFCWIGIISFFWGVYITPNYLIIVSWSRIYRIRNEDIRSISLVNYSGWFSGASRRAPGAKSFMFLFRLGEDEHKRIFPGTLCYRKSAEIQLTQISEHLGVPYYV